MAEGVWIVPVAASAGWPSSEAIVIVTVGAVHADQVAQEFGEVHRWTSLDGLMPD